jgi:hypothetical protein
MAEAKSEKIFFENISDNNGGLAHGDGRHSPQQTSYGK